MNLLVVSSILVSVCVAATPLLLAASGELVVERAGVLNLGVEGMMIMGAVGAFATAQAFGDPYMGAVGGVVVGSLFSILFAVMTQTLLANQVATGLAMTILGLGLSGMIGEQFVGQPGIKMHPLNLPILNNIPIVGDFLFGQDLIFYISIIIIIGVATFLYRTKTGLRLRAVGDNHDSAHALGIKIVRIRYAAIIFGGACAGLAGAQLSLVQVPQWTEGMTAGKGWTALALVVFASWRPARLIAGAYLFGAVSFGQFHAQAWGVPIPAQFLVSLPYIATIVVLVIIAKNKRLTLANTPACLATPFVPDR